MKLLNELITKTAIYKHLKDLYEQALKNNDAYFDRVNKLIDDKNKIAEKYHELTKTDLAKQNKKLKKDIEVYKMENKGQREGIKNYQNLLAEKDKECARMISNQKEVISQLSNDLSELQELNRIKCQECSAIRKNKYIKQFKKILTHVRKLDKKDENIKDIKRLIKEVL